jgi:hypothetical protein
MSKFRFAVVGIALALTFFCTEALGQKTAEFSAEAIALPFPPDARNLEFVAWTRDIKFNSSSPLKSIAAFYLNEMASRGWEHDESAAVVEAETIKLTFNHGKVKIEVGLRQWSKEVKANLDCENISFAGADDPAKLAAAGIPVPKAALFLQKEIPPPEGAVNVQFTGEGTTFKSPLKLQEAFDYFMKLAATKGFRESRRPIITDTRRYTEFKKSAAQLSINIFTDAVGSRIILEYKDEASQRPAPPLAAVASLPIKGGGVGKVAASESTATPVGTTPIDVTSNKGSAAINYNGRPYNFSHVACFQTKSRGNQTMVVFSAKPIPLQKLQAMISAKDNLSFGDLYELSAPEHLVVQLGDNLSFTFALSSTYVGNSVDNAINEMMVEADRVRGTLKMPPKEIFRGEKLSFTATVDAAIITPSTRISGPGDPIEKSDFPILATSPVAFPDGIENAGREGSKFRQTYTALVRKPLANVAAFYRQELAAKGYAPAEKAPTGEPMQFKNDKLEFSVALKPLGQKTTVEVVTRDIALARQEGLLPEPGKGRIVLGNANNAPVVFSIGNANYSLKAEQGAKDYQQAVNQSLAPGTYNVIIKIAGRAQKTEKVELTEGSTWWIIALPMGDCLSVQLY